MAEAAPPARRRSRESTIAALLAAARSVFSQRGYDAATTREVAEAAGVNEQLIQRYFGGKAGLLISVIDAALDVGHGFEHLPEAADLEEEIANIMVFSLARGQERAQFLRVTLYRAIVDPGVAARLEAMTTSRRRAIAERLRRHAGGMPADVVEALGSAVTSLSYDLGVVEQLILGVPLEALEAQARSDARLLAQSVIAG